MNTPTTPQGMVRIRAAIVDKHNLTLYKEDGTTIVIPQGDVRLRPIVESAVPQLVAQNWADVCIAPIGDNSYSAFEKEGSGVVKFFRVAKAKLKNLLTVVTEPTPDLYAFPVPSMQIGDVPVSLVDEALNTFAYAVEDGLSVTPAQDHLNTGGIYDVSEEDEVAVAQEIADNCANGIHSWYGWEGTFPTDTKCTHCGELYGTPETKETPPPKLEQTMAAVNEILAHAIPVASEDFHEKDVAEQGRVVEESGQTIKQHGKDEETHTIIAVVDGNKIIPGMEKIKTQFGRAAKMGSTVGVERFLQRLASVIEQRSHSVEDLLKFMERADLPIADDGTILIYKVLSRTAKDGKEQGALNFYVDCHTNKVEQFVGAYVCMDPSLVDPNRSNECSNGLHVARRGYIKEFSGDICVLAKLAPEDVIAVPSYDANKMRVCGYHIIAELTQEQYLLLKYNKPITNIESGKQLLASALAGQHIHKTHEVRITQQKGGGVVTTKLEKSKLVKVEESPVVVEAEALGNPDTETKDKPTDPMEVMQSMVEAVLSRRDQAQAMYQVWLDAPRIDKQDRYDALLAFKKASKISWERLGIPDPTAQTKTVPQAQAKKGKGKKVVPLSVFKEKAPTPSVFPKAVVMDAPETKKATSKVTEVVQATHGEGSYRDRVQKLIALGLTTSGIAVAVFKLKQQSKKSWDTLGVSEAQVAEIMRLKD